jgi:hypothetical protein
MQAFVRYKAGACGVLQRLPELFHQEAADGAE